MRPVWNIIVVAVFCLPTVARAGENTQKEQAILAFAGSGNKLDSLPKKAAVQIKKSTAASKIVSPDLMTYINGQDHGSSSQYADLYTSPDGLVCINPFFSASTKGIETKVRW